MYLLPTREKRLRTAISENSLPLPQLARHIYMELCEQEKRKINFLDVITGVIRKARKSHFCDLCGKNIVKNEEYLAIEGGAVLKLPYFKHIHITCIKLME